MVYELETSTEFFKEYSNGLAVVLDSNGSVIRQLVSYKTHKNGTTSFLCTGAALTYPTKKMAVHFCKKMGWPIKYVVSGESLGGRFWFIQYREFSNYALASWEA